MDKGILNIPILSNLIEVNKIKRNRSGYEKYVFEYHEHDKDGKLAAKYEVHDITLKYNPSIQIKHHFKYNLDGTEVDRGIIQ